MIAIHHDNSPRFDQIATREELWKNDHNNNNFLYAHLFSFQVQQNTPYPSIRVQLLYASSLNSE